MSNFIKLSTRLINKSHIIEIIRYENNYSIYTSYSSITGMMIYGSGYVRANTYVIEIHKETDKPDYDIITSIFDNS
jgi:hypothetical protein